MKRATKIIVTLGTAVSLGIAAVAVSAHPAGYGWGGGHMGGYGPGYGMGPGMMGNYGPGHSMGPGMMGGYGPGNGMGWGRGHMSGYGPGYGGGPQGTFNGCYGDQEGRLAALKTELGITAEQDSAWQTFVKNAKQQFEKRQAWFAKMQDAQSAASVPERLERRNELMKQRQSEIEANTAALKDLYAALTPEQKAIADERFGGFGPGYGMGYGRGYRGGPGARFR